MTSTLTLNMLNSSDIAQGADQPAVDHFPTVSVVVPIYNGEQDLPKLIEGLLGQTYPADRVEYLLVDNGSCDRTPELLTKASETAQSSGITLRVLSETNIQSSYAARNTGILAATGDVIAFTDADCYPQRNWLTHLVQAFKDPAIGIVVGEVIAFPGHTWLEQFAERHSVLSQKHTLANAFCPYGQTANVAIRASAFKTVGLFRPYLTTGGDADICWRLQKEGNWQLHFAETAQVQHRHRQTLKDLRSQWYRYGKSSRYLHQLHGVKLSRTLRGKELRHSLARWILKDLPLTLGNCARGRADWVDVMSPLLELYCFNARSQGQRTSRLPEAARDVARLPEDPAAVSTASADAS